MGNDTGGALCQMVVTRRPERIGRLVLTSCDYRDNFPPPMFAYFKPVASIPGGLSALMAPMRFQAPRRLPFAFGWLVKRPIDRDAEDSYVFPALTDRERRARRQEGRPRARQALHERGAPTACASSAGRR